VNVRRRYRRINVVGTSGSGKTTFSRNLATILSVPHIEMDAIFWGPNWQGLEDEQFLPRVASAVQQEAWVLDGNYTRTTQIKWAQVECVIWLDLPFFQTVSRVLKRALSRSWTGDELWEGTGNRETLRNCFFSKDSIVLWAIQSYSETKRKYEAAMCDPQYEHIEFVRVRSSTSAHETLERFRDARIR
jgi:adenylate kinase family enzyme